MRKAWGMLGRWSPAAAILLFLLILELAYAPSHFDPTRIKMAVAAFGCGLLCLGSAWWRPAPSRISPALLLALLGLLCYGWLDTWVVHPQPVPLFDARLLHHVGLSCALAALLLGAPALRVAAGAVPFVAVPMALAALLPLFWVGGRPVGGTLGNPNVLAAALALWGPLALHRALLAPRGWRRWCLWGAAGLLLAVSILQRSEAAAAGWGAGLLCYGLLAFPRSKISWTAAGALLVGGASAAAALFISPQGSALLRTRIWTAGLTLAGESPLLGHGLGSFARGAPRVRPADSLLAGVSVNTGNAHDEWLQLLCELGWPGLIAALGAIVLCVHAAWRCRAPRRSMVPALAAGIVALSVDALASPNLRWIAVALPFWMVIGLVGALAPPGLRSLHVSPRAARCLLVPLGLVSLLQGADQVRRALPVQAPLLEGERRLVAGDPADALPPLRAALAHDPDDLRTLFRIGMAHERLRRWDAASAAFERVREIEPHYARVEVHLGLTLLRGGSWPRALAILESASARVWDDEGEILLAEALHGAGRTREALATLDRMVELHERYPPEGRFLPFLRRVAVQHVLEIRGNLRRLVGDAAAG